MKNQITLLTSISLISLASNALAASPTATNYRSIISGINSKFDRDYNDLNDIGEPSPGALKTVESFLGALNTLGVNHPGIYHLYTPENSVGPCHVAGPNCSEAKILVRESLHNAESTLFGAAQAFTWDVIVWTSKGASYERFLEGQFSPVAGTAGQANLTLISCSGCSTVGHSQLEWDGTGATYHLRSKMYDTRTIHQSSETYIGVIVDAFYSPASGEMKMAISAKNVCDSSGTGDSLCSVGSNDHATGYAAVLHANSKTGNVYVAGLQASNGSVSLPSGDAMCIKADKSEDVSGQACRADGIDNFTGITPYSVNDAPITFIAAGNPWPLAEINDEPLF